MYIKKKKKKKTQRNVRWIYQIAHDKSSEKTMQALISFLPSFLSTIYRFYTTLVHGIYTHIPGPSHSLTTQTQNSPLKT